MWRRSTFSGYNGDCVEADVLGVSWKKSMFSANGACVETAHVPADMHSASNPEGSCVETGHEDGQVIIQDSKNPGPHLHVDVFYWPAILQSFRLGLYPNVGPLRVTRRHCPPWEPGKEGNTIVYLFRVHDDDTVLEFTPSEWDAWIAGIQAGQFDLASVG